jgi:hypothetical protein
MTSTRFRLCALFALTFAAGAFLTARFMKTDNVHAQNKRVFELRTYHALPGRLPALQARFRDHTTKLFEQHGMTNIGYWTPQDAPVSENTLIYILAHASRDAAKKSWDDFRNDPEWQRVAKASEADGKIVEKVDSVFMDPTDYSAIK